MIPRRRVPVSTADAAEWCKALCRFGRSPEADVGRFERAFADYVGCAHAVATSSGRDAIELALAGVGCSSGDEVIVPAYTLGELLPMLQRKGYVPVPADVEEDTFNVDPQRVDDRIASRTRAILATHLLGAPCNIEAICEIARARGVAVVEDCAHGLGASVSGRKVGTFGAAGIFSLEVNKAVPTYGGGMLVTNDAGIAEYARGDLNGRSRTEWPAMKKTASSWMEECLVRSPFYGVLARLLFSETFARTFEKFYRGGHDRLRKVKTRYTGFQARIGLRRLAQLDGRNARLNRLWDELARRLPRGFGVQTRDRWGSPAFYNFVALSPIDPRELRRLAARRGVDVGVGTEVMDDCGRMMGVSDCPVAARISERAVLLPLYDGMSRRRFENLIGTLATISGQVGG